MYKNVVGVPVLTTGEFWASEAQKEGKDIYEVMEEFYSSIHDDEKAEAKRILEDKQGALDKLVEYFSYEEDSPIKPIEVLEITESTCSFGSKTTITFQANVKFHSLKDDSFSIKKLNCKEISWSGSFYNPPDYELIVHFLE